MSMGALVLSKLRFGRRLHFIAYHHYHVPSWSAETNQRAFGEVGEPHLHHWVLTVWLEGRLDPVTGMTVDLPAVDHVLHTQVRDRFDNKNFRDVDSYFIEHQPTTEVLAVYFAEKLAPYFAPAKLVKLRIAEDPDLYAEWEA